MILQHYIKIAFRNLAKYKVRKEGSRIIPEFFNQ